MPVALLLGDADAPADADEDADVPGLGAGVAVAAVADVAGASGGIHAPPVGAAELQAVAVQSPRATASAMIVLARWCGLGPTRPDSKFSITCMEVSRTFSPEAR
jgi:hypothetical protein